MSYEGQKISFAQQKIFTHHTYLTNINIKVFRLFLKESGNIDVQDKFTVVCRDSIRNIICIKMGDGLNNLRKV